MYTNKNASDNIKRNQAKTEFVGYVLAKNRVTSGDKLQYNLQDGVEKNPESARIPAQIGSAIITQEELDQYLWQNQITTNRTLTTTTYTTVGTTT